MRNQIGTPPLEREVDSAAPNPALGTTSPTSPHRRTHAGMDPGVVEAARHDDLPYVGGFDKPITERDTNAGLYIGIVIAVIVIVLVAMLFSAFV